MSAFLFAVFSTIADLICFQLARGAFKGNLGQTLLFLAAGLGGWIFASYTIKSSPSTEWGMLLWLVVFIAGTVAFGLASGFRPTPLEIVLFFLGTMGYMGFLVSSQGRLSE